MQLIIRLFLASFFLLSLFKPVYGESSNYVLPYPSSMPGSIFYKIHLIEEKIMGFWSFGNFGQFDYNLRLSDKYLIEAKTLFEYKQYLLGYNALQKSDSYFIKSEPYLRKAEKEGEIITGKRELLRQATYAHLEVLEQLERQVPEKIMWSPEKQEPTELNIRRALEESAKIRRNL